MNHTTDALDSAAQMRRNTAWTVDYLLRHHTREHLVVVPNIFVIGIIETRGRLRGISRQHDQLLRILNRQPLEQDRIDETEDRRVSSDAECQRQHRNRGEPGVLPEQAQTIAEIGQERLQYVDHASTHGVLD